MKTKYLTTLVLLTFLFNFYSCQTIVDLKNKKGDRNPDTYYKDIDDKLNPFEGTWVYDNGNDYIKFVLVKKIKAPTWLYYEDIIIGEIQYKQNGVEKINTLSILNTNLPDPRQYNIWGNYFLTTHTPFDEYTTDNFRLNLAIQENGCLSDMDVRTLLLNGHPAIQIYKWKPLEGRSSICAPIIPDGFYYLMKQ